jgi:hypothetical protein
MELMYDVQHSHNQRKQSASLQLCCTFSLSLDEDVDIHCDGYGLFLEL